MNFWTAVVCRRASDGRLCARSLFPSSDLVSTGSGRLLPAAGRGLQASTGTEDCWRRWASSVIRRPHGRWTILGVEDQRRPCLPACRLAEARTWTQRASTNGSTVADRLTVSHAECWQAYGLLDRGFERGTWCVQTMAWIVKIAVLVLRFLSYRFLSWSYGV